jgi:hypothetical protein
MLRLTGGLTGVPCDFFYRQDAIDAKRLPVG